jgi:DNA-binding response OmpR family regulator
MSEDFLRGECTGTILVIDDNPGNLDFLSSALAEGGYTVSAAISADLALQSLALSLPNLILLDIIMPAMDGYELCRHLKADGRTCDIPVIFISALDEVFDKVEAFKTGAVDYITKPFHIEEVLSRVRTHLTLRGVQQSLEEKNEELKKEIGRRKEMETALLAARDALKHKVKERTEELEETNMALKVLLKRRAEDRQSLEEDITCNVREIILPYLEKLKNTNLKPNQRVFVDILENGINEILSPFIRTLFGRFPNLTPMEFQTATLIQEGKKANDIADILNVSLNTIKFHKSNLRYKFGLKNKGGNLSTFLKTIRKE